MKWCNFLHFYQPANQQKDILEAVVNQCYRPIFSGLLKKGRARLTVNISGALFELLEKYNYYDLLDDIKKLCDLGIIEVVSTASYHAFLPLISYNEVNRQIESNNNILKRYLGESFEAKGFFPPEMACNSQLLDVVADLGFEYIILDEIAYSGNSHTPKYDGTSYIYKNTNLQIFYRQRQPSNILMSGIERQSTSISDVISRYSHQEYLITAMDGETFGHHRPGLERAFLALFDDIKLDFVTISELIMQENKKGVKEQVSVIDSTWASSADDIAKGIQFISWNDPDNKLHAWQWELVNVMLDAISELDPTNQAYLQIRLMADRALASDQFFWACAKPWWSVEMIESGAYACLATIEKIPNIPSHTVEKARNLYRTIISTAFEWQRIGKIREMSAQRNAVQRIPFKTRTLEAGGEEVAVYNAFIDMMKDQERKAAKVGEYEKAILWRDAVYKITTKNDIYDAINAIDLLRMELSNEKVEQMISIYKDKYKQIRGGQPEQRSN